MNYTVPYNGTFCSRKKIQKTRTPSREALEIRDYCRTHTFSVEEKADGEIVDHVHEVNRKC